MFEIVLHIDSHILCNSLASACSFIHSRMYINQFCYKSFNFKLTFSNKFVIMEANWSLAKYLGLYFMNVVTLKQVIDLYLKTDSFINRGYVICIKVWQDNDP